MSTTRYQGRPGAPRMCQQCLNGQCRRHPKQDHGASDMAARKVTQGQASTLDKMYDALVAPQIAKARSELADRDDAADAAFRDAAARDRERALKKKRKHVGADAAALASSGLRGDVAAVMARADASSSSDSDDDSSRAKKKRKKEKKLEKKAKKALKKEKKAEKKAKKEKKSKKDKKKTSSRSASRSPPPDPAEGGYVPAPLPPILDDSGSGSDSS